MKLKNTVLLTLAFVLASATAAAQSVCTIEGKILRDSMIYSKSVIQKVYLSQMDEYGNITAVDSSKIKKGKFAFKRKLAAGEPALLYLLTGFDNGNLPLFVEEGTVSIEIPNASFPAGGKVSGTKNNELYAEYRDIHERCKQMQIDTLRAMEKAKGKEAVDQWLATDAGFNEWTQIGACALVKSTAERLKFLLDHNDSPLAPLMLEKEVYFTLHKEYAKKMLQALSPTLKGHPYYRSYSNVVRALDLKVGGDLPDITIPLADGTTTTLEAFRGKYVLLDFWASWCGPCRKEIPNLVQLFDETADKRDKFVIISFSLDNKEKLWKDAIEKLGMNKEGWVHGSDLLAWGSPAAKMMGVTAIPKAILIDPEGRAISFTLRGQELVSRIKQILAGDLYYMNGGEKDLKE